MREMVRMLVVLTVISLASGGLLAALREGTQERINSQELEFVKGPTIRQVLKEASNDPIAGRFQLKEGDQLRTFFPGVVDGEPKAVAIESSGKGYGGNIGLMVAIDVKSNKFIEVGVTTMSETPGLGAKAKTDPKFAAQFKGRSISEPAKVTQDGGPINAISGATVTSRGVCSGVANALSVYEKLKPEIDQKLKEVKK
jgi:Na+-translocating ferredoxin:NAD+ oxidoreductase subunit G